MPTVSLPAHDGKADAPSSTTTHHAPPQGAPAAAGETHREAFIAMARRAAAKAAREPSPDADAAAAEPPGRTVRLGPPACRLSLGRPCRRRRTASADSSCREYCRLPARRLLDARRIGTAWHDPRHRQRAAGVADQIDEHGRKFRSDRRSSRPPGTDTPASEQQSLPRLGPSRRRRLRDHDRRGPETGRRRPSAQGARSGTIGKSFGPGRARRGAESGRSARIARGTLRSR